MIETRAGDLPHRDRLREQEPGYGNREDRLEVRVHRRSRRAEHAHAVVPERYARTSANRPL